MSVKLLLKVVVAAILLTLLQYFINQFINLYLSVENYGWVLISNFILSAIASIGIINSKLSGYKLILLSFTILYSIGSLNILIEALIFNITDTNQTFNSLLEDFFRFSILSLLLVYFFKKQQNTEDNEVKTESHSAFGWLWRIPISVLLYLILYIIAGIILQSTFPALVEFYKNKLPAMELIIYTQLLRGLIFTGTAIIFLKTCTLGTIKKAIMLGLFFSVVGGIAPLILPNQYMPLYIRIGHGFEVGISNFVYGLCIGFLLNRKSLVNFQNKGRKR